MSLPETELYRVDKLFGVFCEQRVPLHARDQVKLTYKITGSKVVLVESRPYFQDPSIWTEMPIAQFEYSASTKTWTLYAYDRNDKRRRYAKGPLQQLLDEVDKDPTGIFWG